MLTRFYNKEEESIGEKFTPRPKLVLNPEKTNFYEMTIDDFTMEDYIPMRPQLKLELGI